MAWRTGESWFLKPQSHLAYDQVTTYLRPKNGPIVEKTYDWSQRSYDWSQRSWVIARGKSVAARSWSCSKPSHTGLTTRLRPTCDRSQRSWVIEMGKSVATRSMVMFTTWNLLFQIVSGRTSRVVVQLVVPPYDRWHHQSIAHAELHDWSYDRSSGATIDRLWLPLVVRFPSIWWILSSIFSNRCWSRDHAYDQSYDDLPPPKKTDRSMRPLLEIVADIADRSHVRQITTNRTIKQSYDPVWLWLYIQPQTFVWTAQCNSSILPLHVGSEKACIYGLFR